MFPGTNHSRPPFAHAPDAPKRQILLIDDDRDMAEMLAEYLSQEGYVLHVAHTAKAGLDRIREGGHVLIILDVMLPDRDGFSVLHEIRQKSRIPVIMLTTRSGVADKVSGLEEGADDYMPKPFTPLELLARIRTVLRRCQPSRLGGFDRRCFVHAGSDLRRHSQPERVACPNSLRRAAPSSPGRKS